MLDTPPIRAQGSAINKMITASTITCPKCGYQASEQMPTDACQFFYDCGGCGEPLKPEAGDCCVFCSYGTMPCPPTQLNRSHSAPRDLAGFMRIAVAFRAIGDTTLGKAQPGPLRLEHNVILVLLLAFAAAAWAVLVWQQGDTSMDMTMASPAIGLRTPLFLASWVVMMVAMMFPTAMPMILTFHNVQAVKYRLDDAFVSTWVFVGAYLLVWAFAGIATYVGVVAAETAAARAALTPAAEAQIGGVIFMIAGLYQLTPLKELSLSKCRTPIRFIMTSWRDGTAGAFRMGLLHGFYCLGCCWLLFVILFPLGMNVGAMAAITLIILAEKMLPWPRLMPYAAAAALVLYGALVIASSQLHPTFKKDGSAAMPVEMQMKMPGSGSASAMK
jgi:predicted metal-binding membrane protein